MSVDFAPCSTDNRRGHRRVVAVVGGAGYVGLTYSIGLAALGHDVIGLDRDADRIRKLSDGACTIFEPQLDVLLEEGLAARGLRFTTDYADAIPQADTVFICVGTPSTAGGSADLSAVLAAVEEIAKHSQGHTIVVTKSTLPVGSLYRLHDLLTARAPADRTFAVVANPEFLREGSAVQDFFHPDRIVLGSDDTAAAKAVADLYASIDAPVILTDPRSAEMIKYASNAFLATKISFINEMAAICEQVEASIDVVAQGMRLDPRIGSRFLEAGAGFGGSCFPKDVRALTAIARSSGVNTTMLAATLSINLQARQRIVDKLARHLDGLTDKRIAVLGLAFKPGTDDLREAPAVALIQALLDAGASVHATDPVAIVNAESLLPDAHFDADPYAAAMGADAVVLMTEWDDYRALNLDRLANAMRGNTLIDARNALDPSAVRDTGLVYEGVGRPATDPHRRMSSLPVTTALQMPVSIR